MNNLTVLTEVYDNLQSDKVQSYDVLNRLLSNPALYSDPVVRAQALIKNIADIERQQEVTLFFSDQLKPQTQTPLQPELDFDGEGSDEGEVENEEEK